MLKLINIESLNFLYHLISSVFLKCCFFLTLVSFSKYLFLLTLVTCYASVCFYLFGYSFSVPFGESSSSVHLLSASVSWDSVLENVLLYTRFSFPLLWFLLMTSKSIVPAQTSSLGSQCLQIFQGHFKFTVSTTELYLSSKLVLPCVPLSEWQYPSNQ